MKDRFAEALKKLKEDKREIDAKIQALELAAKLLLRTKGGEPVIRQRKRRAKKPKLDMKAASKLVDFLKGRRSPTTPPMVAKRFGITLGAANQRLLSAVQTGDAKRVSRGQYIFVLRNTK